MPRQFGVAGCLVALCLVVAAFPVAGRQDQRPTVFRGGVTFVNVDAYPRRGGHLVEGLKADDFQILEDGKPQNVETFEFIRTEPNVPDAARRDPNSKSDSDDQAADPHNRLFVIYLDTYHTTFAGAHDTRAPLIEFLQRTINATDLFGVLTPTTPIRQLVFGRRLETLEGELTKYFDWGSRDRAISPLDGPPIEAQLETCMKAEAPSLGDALVALNREDTMMTSLEDLMTRLRDVRDERKNLLLISQGWRPLQPQSALANTAAGTIPAPGPNRGGRLTLTPDRGNMQNPAWCDQQIIRLASIDFDLRFRSLLSAANRANVSFYPVDVGGLGSALSMRGTDRVMVNTPQERAARDTIARTLVPSVETLQVLAENTDGRAIVNTNDLRAGFRQIADDLSAYYLLGYSSTNTAADGKYRRIEVKVRDPKVAVTARKGYLAPNVDARAAAASAASSTPVVPAGITEELGRLARLRPDSDLFTYGVRTLTGLDIVAEFSSQQASRWPSGVDVRAVVTRGSGGGDVTAIAKIDAAARGTIIHLPLASTDAGPWKVSVQVLGAGTQTDDRLDVAGLDASAADALLGAALCYRGTASSRIPLRPVADFQFRRTERIHVEWPVLKALDQRTARLLDRRGQPLALNAAVTETPGSSDPAQAKGPTVAVDISLAPLGEGDYVIELTAGQGSRSERSLLAFRVVR